MNAVAAEAAARVQRARSGDQNAMAELYVIGERARRGDRAAKRLYDAAAGYIKQNPSGRENSRVDDIGFAPPEETSAVAPRPAAPRAKSAPPSAAVAPLPVGALSGLALDERLPDALARAAGYRDGLAACVLVLAAGEVLHNRAVNEWGLSLFPNDVQSACFFHGVEFSGEKAYAELAPHVDAPARKALLAGQCVGQARRLQALRLDGSLVSHFDPAIGWELGED